MADERDLYQEIEEELSASKFRFEVGNQKQFAVLGISLMLIMCLGGVIAALLLVNPDTLQAATQAIAGTATPTSTPFPTPAATSLPTLPAATLETVPLSTAPATTELTEALATTESVAISTEMPEEITAIVVTEVASPTPTTLPPTPVPTADLASAIRSPFPPATSPMMARISMEEMGAVAPFSLLTTMGYADGDVFDQMGVIRALTNNYAGDGVLAANKALFGFLPNDPLFLMVGQMLSPADFSAETPSFELSVPWLNRSVKVEMPASLLTQITAPSITINGWLGNGGNVWIIAESPQLEAAIIACRNSLPSQQPFTYPMPDGIWGCQQQIALLSGQQQIIIRAQILMGIAPDGNTLSPLLPLPPAPIQNRWFFADMGAVGAQMALPTEANDLLQTNPITRGWLQATWQADQTLLTPTYIFQWADTDYQLYWNGG